MKSSDALPGGLPEAGYYSVFCSGQNPDRGMGTVNTFNEEVLEDMQILIKDSSFAANPPVRLRC